MVRAAGPAKRMPAAMFTNAKAATPIITRPMGQSIRCPVERSSLKKPWTVPTSAAKAVEENATMNQKMSGCVVVRARQRSQAKATHSSAKA